MNCARGCSPPSEEERQNIKRWSEDIRNLLEHDQAKERFKQFLVELQLDEYLDCLQFWDMCCELEKLLVDIEVARRRFQLEDEATLRSTLNTKCNDLISLALEKINFDLNQLRKLRGIKESPEKCREILPKAKTSIAYKLQNPFNTFLKDPNYIPCI